MVKNINTRIERFKKRLTLHRDHNQKVFDGVNSWDKAYHGRLQGRILAYEHALKLMETF